MSILSKSICGAAGLAFDLTLSRFPAVVRVETTNACNAKCIICPHRSMERKIERMEDELYRQIVDECGAASCREIHLHNFGEPLLDRKLESRIQMAKRRGIPRVKFFSNGALLTEDRVRSLISSGLDEIKISIDGATREEFERIRYPLKFDRVVGNIRRLVEIRDELRAPLVVKVACCSTSDKTATMDMLERTVDEFSFGKIHNWASEDHARPTSGLRKPCSRLWRTFTVLANGDVSLCCLDYDGNHLLGRIDETTSIQDIWNSKRYRQMRALHKRAEQSQISLCGNCTKSFLTRTATESSPDEAESSTGPATRVPLPTVYPLDAAGSKKRVA